MLFDLQKENLDVPAFFIDIRHCAGCPIEVNSKESILFSGYAVQPACRHAGETGGFVYAQYNLIRENGLLQSYLLLFNLSLK